MARVTYGSGITELAGSIGGVTYQKNASGNIAKLRSNPTVNPTALQAGYQNNMAKLVAHWPTLSQANKDSWNIFAIDHLHTTPWGEGKALSGYQWFLSCNLRRMLYYTTVITAAPVWAAQVPPDDFLIETSADYIRLNWALGYDAPLDLIVYCSLPLRQSSLKLRRSLFLLKIEKDLPPISNLYITDVIQSLYNVTWATFYANSNCNIIIRLLQGDFTKGLFSSYTSAIVKIG